MVTSQGMTFSHASSTESALRLALGSTSLLTARTPTVAVTLRGVAPREAASVLGNAGIFTWDGHFYAQALIERLGLLDTGGVLRLGLVHYNTLEEVDRVLDGIGAIVGA